MATHSRILGWKILRTEELGGQYSPWGHKSDMTEVAEHSIHTHTHTHTHTNTHQYAYPI